MRSKIKIRTERLYAMKLIFLLVLLTLAISLAHEVQSRTADYFQPLKPLRSMQVIAHRGFRIAAPENTIPAFKLCIKNHIEWIEIDIRMTKDGQHVIIHDRSLDRTTDGTGLVSEYSLKQIKALDAGSWFAPRFAGTKVPTFREVLEFCRGQINLNLDCINVDPIVLVKEIQAASMEKQVIAYGRPDFLETIRAESNGAIAVQTSYKEQSVLPAQVGSGFPNSVEINHKNITPELISSLKNAGIMSQAQCMGEGDRTEVWRHFIDMGVDWIITDQIENVVAEYTWNLVTHDQPVLIAVHRGVQAFAPENTLAAFQKAIEMGLDFIEIDVRTTRDGNMVIMHDRSLKRTAQVDRDVIDTDLAEIENSSVGRWFGVQYKNEKVPTLDEVLKMGRGKIQFYVDFKDGKPEALVQAMRQHKVVDDCVIYGGPKELAEIKSLEPTAKVMPGLSDPRQIDDLIELCSPYAFDAKWEILSEKLISECHKKGVKVFSDSMGNYETIGHFRQAMEWNIDCIQTDEPLILMRAIELYIRTAQP